MSNITKSITIKAPIAKVFDFVTSPDNWTKYVTSLVEIKNLSAESPQRGSTFSWAYKMMGVKFSGRGTVTENIKNKAFSLSLKSKIQINEHYDFTKNEDGTTDLKIKIDYEMPGDVLKIIANSSVVEKLNNLEAKSVLEKVKTLCEG